MAEVWPAIVQATQAAGLWQFDRVDLNANDILTAITDPRGLWLAVGDIANGAEMIGPGPAESQASMSAYARHDTLFVSIGLTGDALLDQRRTWLDSCRALVTGLVARLPPEVLIGPTIQVIINRLTARQLADPFGHGPSVLRMWSRRFAESKSPKALEMWERRRTTPLVPGFERYVEGDLLTLQYVRDLTDVEALDAALEASLDWPVPRAPRPVVVTAPVDRKPVLLMGGEVRPPLTRYVAVFEVGYKAVVPSASGTFDEETVAELQAILRAGKLADGTPVKAIDLIVPTRDQALATESNAKAAGFRRVLFPDDQGELFEPVRRPEEVASA